MTEDRTWRDDAGCEHSSAGRGARILSLVPSITELLFDLDLGREVVGRTTYCVHPASGVDRVPTVGGTKKINVDKALALRPTHAIVNVDENPKELADALRSCGIDVIVTHPIQPTDNVRLYQLLGGIFGRERQSERLTGEFMAEMAHVQTRKGDRHGKRVLYLVWKDPWMTVSGDTYISRMLALIDWHTVGHNDNVRYPLVELSELLANVEIVLLPSEPFPFQPEDVEAFRREHPDFPGVVRHVDGERISWYGSRAVRGLRYLVELAESSSPA